jgi:ankyrin repeat protein
MSPCVARRDKYGDTPLIWASKKGHARCVEALIAGKADVKVAGKHGDTALHWAAKRAYADICKALMAAGARARVQDDEGTTPIHWAKGPELKVFGG